MERGKLATAAARALRRFEQYEVHVDRERGRIVFNVHGRRIEKVIAPFLVVWRVAYSESYSVTTYDSLTSLENAVRIRLIAGDPIYRYQPVAAYDLARGKKLKLNLRVSASV